MVFGSVWRWFSECRDIENITEPPVSATVFWILGNMAILSAGTTVSIVNSLFHRKLNFFFTYLSQYALVHAFSAATDALVFAGTQLLSDTTCSDEPNGLSGEVTCYMTLTVLLVRFALSPDRTAHSTLQRALSLAAVAPVIMLFMFVAIFQYHTGAHTPRQIAIAALLATILASLFVGLLAPMASTKQTFTSQASAALVVGSVICTWAYIRGTADVRSTILPLVMAVLSIGGFAVGALLMGCVEAVRDNTRKLADFVEFVDRGCPRVESWVQN
ncbi:hypothetical protein J8273_0991 [Carpediemonas membranifera]|uniref:Uncharacterized protein n=1 Tax=Carpediemonas membranifera TaxID=201153 RepID=A0A8J6B771_9EUKA|nr:hypothetical protein J8273_0991 [Carpediemonas membranifera]|eukprot:KAG9397083.1 hypothetical protein J8273_0991 [Carpediemonas membranifera]